MTTAADTTSWQGESAPSGSVVRGARRLTGATAVIGLLNYVYSLGLTHLLEVGQFAVFAAGQALLLSAGTISNTSVPWVLARALAQAETPLQRRQAVWFAVLTNGALGLVAGAVVGGLSLRFASPPVAAVLSVSTALILLSSTTAGLLQGDQRFGLLGALRTGDAVVKIVAGLVLVALGAGQLGALAGFGLGALMLVAVGAALARGDLGPARGALHLRQLWTSAAGVGGVQALVSVLVTVDLVLVAVLVDDVAQAATYQASMIL